jgi:hypothetical protein
MGRGRFCGWKVRPAQRPGAAGAVELQRAAQAPAGGAVQRLYLLVLVVLACSRMRSSSFSPSGISGRPAAAPACCPCAGRAARCCIRPGCAPAARRAGWPSRARRRSAPRPRRAGALLVVDRLDRASASSSVHGEAAVVDALVQVPQRQLGALVVPVGQLRLSTCAWPGCRCRRTPGTAATRRVRLARGAADLRVHRPRHAEQPHQLLAGLVLGLVLRHLQDLAQLVQAAGQRVDRALTIVQRHAPAAGRSRQVLGDHAAVEHRVVRPDLVGSMHRELARGQVGSSSARSGRRAPAPGRRRPPRMHHQLAVRDVAVRAVLDRRLARRSRCRARAFIPGRPRWRLRRWTRTRPGSPARRREGVAVAAELHPAQLRVDALAPRVVLRPDVDAGVDEAAAVGAPSAGVSGVVSRSITATRVGGSR